MLYRKFGKHTFGEWLMATATAEYTTTEIKTALRTARRAQPDLTKTELASRIIKATRKRGRGRPPADLAGLVPVARYFRGWTVGKIVRAFN